MKIIFAGTPVFACVALQRLHAAGFDIALVLSQPDRPAGRGLKLQASPVKQFALDHHIPVAQPRSLRLDGRYPEDAAAARRLIEAADADAMVVAAYGLILPQWVLDVMGGDKTRKKWGCLNIHASLLPRWRGAAPIHRAIEAGDAQTGVTIMQMDAGLDTGDMLLTERLTIGEAENTGALHDRLAVLGGRMIVEALELAACGGLRPVAQAADGVTYAHKIEKAEALIDWRQPAAVLARRVRAFDPFPGASFLANGESVKLWSARAEPGTAPVAPGTVRAVADDGIHVQTGDGVLVLTALQRAGGKRLPVGDFLRGFPMAPGLAMGGAGSPGETD